jgi:hypothetical protein
MSPQSPRSGRAPARPASASRPTSARLSALLVCVALAAGAAGCGDDGDGEGSGQADRFDSAAAFALIEEQVAAGQRPAGSAQLRELAERLRAELPNGRFEDIPGHPGLRNVVGTLPGPGPAVVVAAHYDTEFQPPGFVGANDGAAGTAAVIELARTLERELPEGHREVRFVLFDGEEEPPGCPSSGPGFQRCALRGSKAYARAHRGEIGELILLDYVANEGLRLPREANSNPALYERLREAAHEAGFGTVFEGDAGSAVIDDHIPFVLQGIPAIDLIDFSYRYADTVEDTPDKLSEDSLDAVGESVAELVIALASEPQE